MNNQSVNNKVKKSLIKNTNNNNSNTKSIVSGNKKNNQQKNNNQSEQNPYERGCIQARRNIDRGRKFATTDRAAKYAKQTYLKKGDRRMFGLMLTSNAKQFIKGYSNKMAQSLKNSNSSNNNAFWNKIDNQLGDHKIRSSNNQNNNNNQNKQKNNSSNQNKQGNNKGNDQNNTQNGGGRRCSAFTCEKKRCKRRTRLGKRCSSHC